MDWTEEERKISPEELRREMYRILVSNNIITEKDLKARVEEELQPELDNFVKATSYILESHKSLFKLFNQNGAYYEAVKLARRLVEAKVIDKKEEPYHYTPYYFDKDDNDTTQAIDKEINKLFTEDGKRRLKEKKLKPEPEFITVSKYLLQHHPDLFANSTTRGSTFTKANYIAELLAAKGVISRRNESYHNSRLYFRREAIDTMDRINYAISNGVLKN